MLASVWHSFVIVKRVLHSYINNIVSYYDTGEYRISSGMEYQMKTKNEWFFLALLNVLVDFINCCVQKKIYVKVICVSTQPLTRLFHFNGMLNCLKIFLGLHTPLYNLFFSPFKIHFYWTEQNILYLHHTWFSYQYTFLFMKPTVILVLFKNTYRKGIILEKFCFTFLKYRRVFCIKILLKKRSWSFALFFFLIV